VPNVLVADDNPVSLRFFADALAQLGLSCALADDGLEAVALAERTGFDLLLLDARMPGLDGAQALAQIRAGAGPSRSVVALATSADASAAVRRVLLQTGFVDVLAKPMSLHALRSSLDRYFPQLGREGTAQESRPPDAALDDTRALAAAGGDAGIVAALRGLLVGELDALPDEIENLAASADVAALRDRLHRLDASAGFCGAPGLTLAGARLRSAMDAKTGWPHAAAADFLAACADVRALLVRPQADDAAAK
jgi:CheY-like chemotaxis protein